MVFSYRDMLVTPAAVSHGEMFAALAHIQDVDGRQRSVRLPGEFSCVEEAIRYSISAAFEFIDRVTTC